MYLEEHFFLQHWYHILFTKNQKKTIVFPFAFHWTGRNTAKGNENKKNFICMHTYTHTHMYRYKQQMEKKILPGSLKSPSFFAACGLDLLHRRQFALNHLKTRHLIRTQTNCTSLVMSVLAIRSWPWPAQQNKETVPSSATQSKISWVYLPCSRWGVAQIHLS